MTGHPRSTTSTPPRKQQEPFARSAWQKKATVRWRPTQEVNPGQDRSGARCQKPTSYAEEVSDGQEALVEEHEDAEKEEKDAEAAEADAELLLVRDLHVCN